jgi:hypothetical protein
MNKKVNLNGKKRILHNIYPPWYDYFMLKILC